MKGKIMEVAVVFFVAALLIYLGTTLLIRIWWVLALLIAIITAIVILIKIYLWRYRNRW